MEHKVIFQRTYQHLEDYVDLPEPECDATEDDRAAEEFVHGLFLKNLKERVFLLRPERMDGQKQFVNKAIAISENCEIDLVVMEHADRVTAEFTIWGIAGVTQMKEIFQMADEIWFLCGLKDNEARITLEYFTHAVYQGESRIR